MIYTAIDTFYMSPGQLEDSPSRKDGIDKESETTLRIYGAELVQEAGILLKLPQVVMATGQVLLHRFFSKQSFARYNVKRVAASCVWLAGKLEESYRKIRDILIVFNRINQRRESLPLEPLELFSKTYDDSRTELIRMERHLLKEMGFICHVEHPHKFIPLYLAQLGVEDPLVQQEAWSLANDSLRTALCVRFKSEVVACGVIYAAARRARIPLPENPAWWLIFDATKNQIDEICKTLADLYGRPKAVYIEVGKEHSTVLSSRAWHPPAGSQASKNKPALAVGMTTQSRDDAVPLPDNCKCPVQNDASGTIAVAAVKELRQKASLVLEQPSQAEEGMANGEKASVSNGHLTCPGSVLTDIANGRRRRITQGRTNGSESSEDGVLEDAPNPEGSRSEDVVRLQAKLKRTKSGASGSETSGTDDTGSEDTHECGEQRTGRVQKEARKAQPRRTEEEDVSDNGSDGLAVGFDENLKKRRRDERPRPMETTHRDGLDQKGGVTKRSRVDSELDKGRSSVNSRGWSLGREKSCNRDSESGRIDSVTSDRRFSRSSSRRREIRVARDGRDFYDREGAKRYGVSGDEGPRNGRSDISRGGRDFTGTRLHGRITRGK